MNQPTSKCDCSKPDVNSNERYNRQLPLFGKTGQQKLAEASVFIAGAGGLGSPVATYLAAAGVGKIVLLDCDSVEVTNLNRQFLHRESDIGRMKAESGAEKLKNLNSEICVEPVCALLDKSNIEEIVGDCQIIVDALDNDKTRQILASFAKQTKKTYFHAAVSGFRGQFTTFYPETGPCYFCAFPEDEMEPVEETNLKKEKTFFPIVGATAGIIGSMEANEIIKYITGSEKIKIGKLFIWDGLSCVLDVIDIEQDENCPVCGKNDKNSSLKTR